MAVLRRSASYEKTPDQSDERVALKKQITLSQSIAIILGVIIGSGIFVAPVGILQNVRSSGMSFVMWTVTGIYSTLCALCFAELGSTIPESGGEYIYIRRAFGDFPAFLTLWLNFVIICPVNIAAASLIFATYLLRPMFPDCGAPVNGIRLLAAIIIVLVIAVNCYGVKWATKAQVVITVSKLCALFIIIVIGFVFIGRGEVDNFQDSFAGSDYSAGAIAIAFYSGFWAFGGWSYLNFLTDELIEPHKNLPRAIIISMIIVTSVYLIANVAYIAVLTPGEMLTSPAVAVTFAEQTIPSASFIMPILIALSVMGSMNGCSLSLSRLFYVGARNGHLPRIISMIHSKRLTPSPSLITILIFTLLLQSIGDIFYLIEMMGFSFSIVLCGVFAGQVYLRYKEPDLPRPIKLPIVLPAFLFLVNLAILSLTIYQKPDQSMLALGLLCLGVPFYIIGVRWEKKPKEITQRLNSWTVTLQKIMMVVPQEDEPACS